MAGSFKDYFQNIGFNVDIDDPASAVDNTHAAANKAKVTEKLREHVVGYDKITGAPTYLDEHAANSIYKDIINKEGTARWDTNKVGDASAREARAIRTKTMVDNDFKRSQGMSAGPGLQSGYTMGIGGYKRASRTELLKSAIPDTGRAIGENFKNSLGIATAQQKEQFRSSGMLGKGMSMIGPVLGAATIFSTLANGGDIYDTMTFNLAAGAGMAGFTAGSRSFGALVKGASKAENTPGDLLKGITRVAPGTNVLQGGKMRLAAGAVGGALGGVVGAGLVGGSMWAVSDLTSNKSILTDMARGYSKLSSRANIEQNNRTLTMRQQALQQLSQSAMNDRASLLGNEAAVLRGVL